jgi:hypothetical protein
VEPVVSIKPAAVAGSAERVSLADLSKELLGAAPVRAPQPTGPTPRRLQVPPVVEAPKTEQITRSILEQIESAETEPDANAPEAGAAAKTSEASKAEAVRQEFEGLKFPGDGVLTRQWMDFLNQMTATK